VGEIVKGKGRGVRNKHKYDSGNMLMLRKK